MLKYRSLLKIIHREKITQLEKRYRRDIHLPGGVEKTGKYK
jgi:hypothetical protein